MRSGRNRQNTSSSRSWGNTNIRAKRDIGDNWRLGTPVSRCHRPSRSQTDGRQLLEMYMDLGLKLNMADSAVEAGLTSTGAYRLQEPTAVVPGVPIVPAG